MDPTISLPRRLLSLLLRLFSFVALKELYLSLLLRRLHLVPATVHLPSPSTVLHLWIPSNRRHRSKPPLLLIHGFGGNSKWQFEYQIKPLSESFDLYIPDLVFFGRSRTEGKDRSVGFQAKCLVEAMRRLGVERYSVAGISYGGFVAYGVAEIGGEAVERVVIMTAGVCTTAEERRELMGREEREVTEILLPRRAEDLMALIRRSMYRPPKWVPRFLLRDFIEVMYKDRRNERAELLRDLLTNEGNTNNLTVLKQETLILWGSRDNVFPIRLAYQLQRHLGKKARLEVIQDAGHALQLEKPDLVNHMIQCFLLEPKKCIST